MRTTDDLFPRECAPPEPDRRPLRLQAPSLSAATGADRARRRELVLHALELSRASGPRRRPVSRFTT